MDKLRKRVPFKFSEDVDTPQDTDILDEQQQDAVIEQLRSELDIWTRKYILFLRIILGLSFTLHLLHFQINPLLSIFPPSGNVDAYLPGSAIFSSFNLLVHLYFIPSLFPKETRLLLDLSNDPEPPSSFLTIYLISFIAPITSLYLQRDWQTTVWWSSTPFAVFVTQTVLETIRSGSKDIKELERLKYNAPSA